MNRNGFAAFGQQEDKVTTGQKLLTFDRRKIAEAGHSDRVISAIINAADLHDIL
jgi:phosphotransferase system IIA component